MTKKITAILFLCFCGIYQSLYAQSFRFSKEAEAWAEQKLSTLSPSQKIAQLFMVAAYSNKDEKHYQEIEQLIKNQQIGGLIFFQGTPTQQARLTNRYQMASQIPLLISIDGEWGLAMRLDSMKKYPYQMTLGAIQNDSLIQEMGKQMALQCKRMGIHVNLAPVADVNNNADNPVINFRSFGENTQKVMSKSLAYMQGMQQNGVLACGKHFPGHGDTNTDSHFTLPIIKHSIERLESIEFKPFEYLIQHGLGSMMVAHLQIPALDSIHTSTLSKKIVTNLLKEKMQFEGLIFTDALNMKAVSTQFEAGIVDVKAFLAGNDVLLFSENVPKGIEEIQKAIQNKEISIEEVDRRCKKVLMAKYTFGAKDFKPIVLQNLVEDLNNPHAELISRKLYEKSITLLHNSKQIIPLQDLTKRMVSISLGVDSVSFFQHRIQDYLTTETLFFPNKIQENHLQSIENAIKNHDMIIVGLHLGFIKLTDKFGLNDALLKTVQKLIDSKKAIICVFGNPYSLNFLERWENAQAVLLAYENNQFAQDYAAQALFGGIGIEGKLPVSLKSFALHSGISTQGGLRFQYTIPEELNINRKKLNKKMDSLAAILIQQKAAPGATVLIAQHGKVFFHQTYGHHTYEALRPIRKHDIYDFASITKITTSIPALMRLYEEGKFKLDESLDTYLKAYRKSNKKGITFRELLTHQGFLKAWIPFWKDCIDDKGNFKPKTFAKDSSARYSLRVVDGLYLHKKYPKIIEKQILNSPLRDKKEYVYSDLSFYLYPKIVEKITKMPFETYLKTTFYQDMGANSLGFNAWKRFPLSQIIPTEYDSAFRKTLLHGTVDDEGAAMLDGISGHAGLFGSTTDLAKLMQLYLWKGKYGGKQYLQASTIEEFTKKQFMDNHRGLGFDKPYTEYSDKCVYASDASPSSYGHTGFTGTFTWADPENGLLFLLMTNRVNPSRNNRNLLNLNLRPQFHQAVYEVLQEKVF